MESLRSTRRCRHTHHGGPRKPAGLSRADQLAFRWLVAAGILLVLGVLALFYVAITGAFASSLPHDRALEYGLQDAGGNSLAFVIPADLVVGVGAWLLRRPPTGWRRLLLVLAGLYLAWTLAAIAVGIGVLFVPSALCAVIFALLANGV
jgi:hypothetical protein